MKLASSVKKEKIRPKSSYVRGSFEEIEALQKDKQNDPLFETAKKTQ